MHTFSSHNPKSHKEKTWGDKLPISKDGKVTAVGVHHVQSSEEFQVQVVSIASSASKFRSIHD